jgi:hypothetical protein
MIMADKIVNFEDVSFPAKKYFKTDVYQRLHTFPASVNVLNAYKVKYKGTHDMKIIPVISISGKKEYMIYIKEKKKKVRK